LPEPGFLYKSKGGIPMEIVKWFFISIKG
jgi:hypothetical protein